MGSYAVYAGTYKYQRFRRTCCLHLEGRSSLMTSVLLYPHTYQHIWGTDNVVSHLNEVCGNYPYDLCHYTLISLGRAPLFVELPTQRVQRAIPRG
jgi:hypothetical protein